MSDKFKYDMRGVSATKDEVHRVVDKLDKGLYPNAFCKILPDVVGQDPSFCNIMHADTAGTKGSLAYMYWKETGDLSVWKGIVQDAIVMNIDDMACVGCLNDIVLSSTIGRNKNLIPGEVIATIINFAIEFCEMLERYGVKIHLAGGETADVGDVVRTIDVGYTTFARMEKERVVVNNIKAGNVIVGLASYGKASYEDEYNGGMGSNGLTSARHDVFSKKYAEKYPDSFDSNVPDEVVYIGTKSLQEEIEIDGFKTTVGKLVLSPTRTYVPILKKIFDEEGAMENIQGIIHCSGGAHTKVKKFIKNKHIIKDNLLEVPPLFHMIQKESGTSEKEMYQVFNMGTRLEMYTNELFAKRIIEISKSFNVDAQIIGRVEEFTGEKVTIINENGRFEY